jgi:hypothetical protein
MNKYAINFYRTIPTRLGPRARFRGTFITPRVCTREEIEAAAENLMPIYSATSYTVHVYDYELDRDENLVLPSVS